MNEVMPDSAKTQQLLRQVRAGDHQALDQLLARHQAYLQQLVEIRLDQRLRRRVDPSDVIQECHLEALRRLEDYLEQPAMPFRLWLRQLTCDRIRMVHRSHFGTARRAMQREVGLPERSSLLLAQQFLASSASPSQKLVQQELVRRVRQAIAQLSETDREILLMRTFEGLSFEEAAHVLNIEAAAARKRHGRAILRLHKALSDGGLTESQL